MPLAEALTRRQAQAQESRRRLMDGALALFARQGYAETSVHAICQSAGMADGLLYHYFPDGKQELLHALVEEHIRAVITELRARANTLMDDLPIEEVLEQLYQNINDIVLRHAAAFQMLLRERNVLELVSMEQLFGCWFLSSNGFRACCAIGRIEAKSEKWIIKAPPNPSIPRCCIT